MFDEYGSRKIFFQDNTAEHDEMNESTHLLSENTVSCPVSTCASNVNDRFSLISMIEKVGRI